jgi:hypothetical protein
MIAQPPAKKTASLFEKETKQFTAENAEIEILFK